MKLRRGNSSILWGFFGWCSVCICFARKGKNEKARHWEREGMPLTITSRSKLRTHLYN